MYYLGTPKASAAPDFIPAFPYLTLKARSDSPVGPWIKQYELTPFSTKPDTWMSATASPGQIIRHQGELVMFFSASTDYPIVKRTLGIARTTHPEKPWRVDPKPILPPDEQIENSSLHFEPSLNTWFLFTNHIGVNASGVEFTDAVWVYWSADPLVWNPGNKAVVLDGTNCQWSKRCIGMPGVIAHGGKLAVLYDAPGGDSTSHMRRDIGLAWLDLPLAIPSGDATR
jgi:hypothetical protein